MQLSSTIWLVVACLAPSTIYAQLLGRGRCPEVQEMEPFDVDRFMGHGYEYASYPDIRDTNTKCNSLEYERQDADTILVHYSSMNARTGIVRNATDIGKFEPPATLKVDNLLNKNPFKRNTFILLGTDYDSYAVLYSCIEINPLAHFKNLWIVTRSRNPSEDTIKAAKKVVEDNNLPTRFLIKADQEECPNDDDSSSSEENA